MKFNKIIELNAEERVWAVEWHPEGNIIASVGSSKSIKIWKKDHNQWSFHSSIETEHTKTIRCVKFNHTGKSIACCSFDCTISIYILSEGNYEFLTSMEGHESEVKCVDWHLSDKKIVSCSRDKNVWVWGFNEVTYEYQCENVLEGHLEDVKYVAWLDSSRIASASYDNTIRIWSQNDDDYQCIQVLQQHSSIVWAFTYQISTNRLFSVGEDRKVHVWHFNDQNNKFESKFEIVEIHTYPIYTCAIFQSISLLITGSGDNSLCLLDVHEKQKEKYMMKEQMKEELMQKAQNKEKYVLERQYHEADVNCVRTFENKQEMEEMEEMHEAKIKLMVASCSDDQKIIIWEIKT